MPSFGEKNDIEPIILDLFLFVSLGGKLRERLALVIFGVDLPPEFFREVGGAVAYAL
jgi:hypothetical protein